MTSSILSGYLNTQGAATSQLSSSSSASGSSSSSGTSADLASGASSLSTSYQTFLTLLTTQLKNQDPSSPMDPNQFTTELVQMTGVQQQLLSNQLLQQLVNAAPSSGVSNAVGLIGKAITANSATANLSGGQASWTYNLPEAASSATVSVTNSSGQVVYTGAAPSFSAGTNSFTWNGQSSTGVQMPDGTYTLSVAATDSAGGTITPTLSVSGVATSVQNVNGTTMLTLGSTQVPVSSVTNVTGD
jgi:flagellar basal-body rod modification protein FlgD